MLHRISLLIKNILSQMKKSRAASFRAQKARALTHNLYKRLYPPAFLSLRKRGAPTIEVSRQTLVENLNAAKTLFTNALVAEEGVDFAQEAVDAAQGELDEFDSTVNDLKERMSVVQSNFKRAKAEKKRSYDNLLKKSDFAQLPDDVLDNIYQMVKPTQRDVINMKEVRGQGLKPYQIRGSQAAKEPMATLRALRGVNA
jgi:hypothetical protein